MLSRTFVFCLLVASIVSAFSHEITDNIHIPYRNVDHIRNIHVVFSNHLDVGFTNYSISVINRYFHVYFPRAYNTGMELLSRYNITYNWMTQSYLISLYFDCPQNNIMGIKCPTASQVATTQKAIDLGFIYWHAFPFNAQNENYDRNMFEFGLKMTQDLNNQYNHYNTTKNSYYFRNSLVLSQRDVPGMSRGVIPSLIKYGIKGISVGVNRASAKPKPHFIYNDNITKNYNDRPPNHEYKKAQLILQSKTSNNRNSQNSQNSKNSNDSNHDPNIFLWRSNDGENDIITMYHGRGYGGIKPIDCIIIDTNNSTFNHTLATAWKGDNEGPHYPFEVLRVFEQLKEEFPNATNIFSSSFSQFVTQVINDKEEGYNKLPIVDEEIGNTWAHGCSADPWKLAAFRVIQRVRTKYLDIYGDTLLNDECFYNFSRLVIKNGEHTFGSAMRMLDPIKRGPDSEYYAWSNEEFNKVLNHTRTIDLINSWYEQRNLGVIWPLDALSNKSCNSTKSNNYNIISDMYNEIYDEIYNVLFSPQSPLDSTSVSVPSVTSSQSLIEERNVTGDYEWQKVSNTSEMFTIKNNKDDNSNISYNIQFDATVGYLKHLSQNGIGINYITKIGSFLYQTFTEQLNFEEFLHEYTTNPYAIWIHYNFGKVGLDKANNYQNKYQNIETKLINLYQSGIDSNIFCVKLSVGNNNTQTDYLQSFYGSPQFVYVVYNFTSLVETKNNNNNNHNSSAMFEMQLTWINKIATRIPESLWLMFEPDFDAICEEYWNKMARFGKSRNDGNYNASTKATWAVDKFGQMMDINNVADKGQYHVHGTMGNVSYYCQFDGYKKGDMEYTSVFSVESVDASIAGFIPITMDTLTPFPTPFVQSNVTAPFGYNLANTIWGTNFPEWIPFDDNNVNATFRFRVYV